MTPTSVFDPHAMIQWLAEVQQECPGDGVTGRGGSVEHNLCHCTRCDDTSRVAPFAALRVECPGTGTDGVHLKACSKCDLEDCDCCCVTCSGKECPGWVPEPDVRVACWEILKANPKIAKAFYSNSMSGAWYWYDNKNAPNHKGWTRVDTAEEALLRAAKAAMKEHKA